jgi:hypothetical protein
VVADEHAALTTNRQRYDMNAYRRVEATMMADKAQAAADTTESTQLDAAWRRVEKAWKEVAETGTLAAWEVAYMRDSETRSWAMELALDAEAQANKEAEEMT